ncbi:hypothetical protein C8Q76DRAFT_797058 [Earliella scabrosa]|nr:hypothetical protein C8Q76DRAFT_797058 [Earliella scabrosa]
MSTVVCATQHHQLPPAGRYHWATSSSERSSRPASLRIVPSDSAPSCASQISDAIPPGPLRQARCRSSAASSSQLPTPDAMRDKARHATFQDGAGPALPFPSHNVGAPSSPISAHPSLHARAKSTTTAPSASPDPLRRPRRVRAASSATMPTSRPRLPSMLASVLTQHKAPAQPRTAAHDPELVGSFTPTSSPRPRLRSLLSGAGEVHGSAGTSSSAQPIPPPSQSHSGARLRHQSDARLPQWTPSSFRPRSHSRSHAARAIPDDDAPPSPDLPSICRTPSSYSGSDYFPTAPSSAGPPTPVHTITTLPSGVGTGVGLGLSPAPVCRKSEALHPVLEKLERASMFRVQTACATCGKRGSNFPCCPKCGEMWCSRECRLKKAVGKRHVCARKSA